MSTVPEEGYYWIEQNHFVSDDFLTVAQFWHDRYWYFVGWGAEKAMNHKDFLARGMKVIERISEPKGNTDETQ